MISAQEAIKVAARRDAAGVKEWLESQFAATPGMDQTAELARVRKEIEYTLASGAAERATLVKSVEVLNELVEWGDASAGMVHIERAHSSRVHELVAAMQVGEDRVVTYNPAPALPRDRLEVVFDDGDAYKVGHVFLVEHDWASAFAGAQDYDDRADYRLPYDRCTFEFCMNGRRVICLARQDGTSPSDMAVMMELRTSIRNGWYAFGRSELTKDIVQIALRQVRAICVSLEAEVAEAEAIRIPEKLRKARERSGKLPPFDHHIIRLHRRVRAARYEGEHVPGARKRLHFRRGHWRRYETHRTWIKWTLVGNPDLGFVDKEYRL